MSVIVLFKCSRPHGTAASSNHPNNEHLVSPMPTGLCTFRELNRQARFRCLFSVYSDTAHSLGTTGGKWSRLGHQRWTLERVLGLEDLP